MCKPLCLGDYRGHNSIAFRETIPHAVNTLPVAPAAAADRQPPPGRPSPADHQPPPGRPSPADHQPPPGRPYRQTVSRHPADHRQQTTSPPPGRPSPADHRPHHPADHHQQTTSRHPADHHSRPAGHHSRPAGHHQHYPTTSTTGAARRKSKRARHRARF